VLQLALSAGTACGRTPPPALSHAGAAGGRVDPQPWYLDRGAAVHDHNEPRGARRRRRRLVDDTLRDAGARVSAARAAEQGPAGARVARVARAARPVAASGRAPGRVLAAGACQLRPDDGAVLQ